MWIEKGRIYLTLFFHILFFSLFTSFWTFLFSYSTNSAINHFFFQTSGLKKAIHLIDIIIFEADSILIGTGLLFLLLLVFSFLFFAASMRKKGIAKLKNNE